MQNAGKFEQAVESAVPTVDLRDPVAAAKQIRALMIERAELSAELERQIGASQGYAKGMDVAKQVARECAEICSYHAGNPNSGRKVQSGARACQLDIEKRFGIEVNAALKGHRLVLAPDEPTEEMFQAADESDGTDRGIYLAMLAARPKAQS